MNAAYKNKRLFWHNLKRFDNLKIKTVGVDDIIIAGVEFNLYDHRGCLSNLFVAANSLNESCFCYEKNNASEMGFLEGINNTLFDDLISKLLTHAADITYNMEEYKTLPKPPKKDFVNFFALGRQGRFYKTLTYDEVHCEEHPYYAFFMYAQKLIREIRKVEFSRLVEKQKDLERKIKKQRSAVKKKTKISNKSKK